jgi:hypothetical protein
MTTRTAYGVPASGQGYLRASTVDRERAIDVIKAGYAEGRLSMPEYEARASQALAARTVADLAMVTADLPGGHVVTPAWPPARNRVNSLAVAALACGVGQLFFGPLPTVPAIVLGHLARREIRRTGEDGNGLATFGLVLGWAGAGLILLAALIVVLVIAAIR